MQATELTLAQAARELPISKESLRLAINRDELPARKGQREYAARRYGTRTHWIILRSDLEEWFARLPACRYPGCKKPGSGPTGCCSGPHAQGVAMAGKRRPGIGEKISAARRGVPRGPHSPERVAAIADGLQRFWESEDSRTERTRRARTMTTPARQAAAYKVRHRAADPRKRQRTLGRWGGQAHGHKGGAPRRYDSDAATEVRRLKAQHPSWGRATIARATGLTEKQVRAILAQTP